LRKLLVLAYIVSLSILCSLSCAQPEQRAVRGGTPHDGKDSERSLRSIERTSLREFGRDWKERYSEKTMKRRYGLSDRQFETAKQELVKKDPSFTTKAAQGSPGFSLPQSTD